LDLPESNERLQKYKELKKAFDVPYGNDLEINIFRNLQKVDVLQKLEQEFDLSNLQRINYQEDFELNKVYDEILSKYEIH